ncbi:MFS transporter [Kitasatospora viridis]|uniref:MFS transporter n=1 Tax=Kitasatospora viridis TaxID=281105 RepID=A0A561TTH5_9ACTN|nr:MFS transporter [Kitasatospora viridis]TWF90422.1 MFS transporter [Kitasatospora viridis]
MAIADEAPAGANGTAATTAATNTATNDPADTAKWGLRAWLMLVVVCAAFSLDALDNIMIGIATPQIKNEFSMSTSGAQWVVSAYVLGFGGFLMLGGRFSDLLGRRRVFLTGLTVLALGSLLGGTATTGAVVIAGRLVMGIGAALTAPSALSIVVGNFPEGPQRNRALGIYTACGAVGYSIGVVVGGALTEASWRWTFVLSIPVAIAALVGALLLVPKDPANNGGERHYDVAGAITVTGGMLLLVYAIVQAPQEGWLSGATLGVFAAAVLLLAAFAVIETRAPQPLLRLGLLRNKPLLGASLIAAAILGTYMSYQFVGGLYLQTYRGWSPLEMAFAFLPIGLLILVLAPRAGKLIPKIGLRWMMFGGMAAYAVAFLLFLRVGADSSYWTVLLPSMVLIGAGFPFAFTAANVQATAGLDDSEQGLAAGILQTGYQVGAAVVLAVVTVRMGTGSKPSRAQLLSGYHQGTWVIIVIAALSALAVTAAALAARARSNRAAPAGAANDLAESAR